MHELDGEAERDGMFNEPLALWADAGRMTCIDRPDGEVATRRSAKPLWAGATPARASGGCVRGELCACEVVHALAVLFAEINFKVHERHRV